MQCLNQRVINVKFNDPKDIYIVNDRYITGHKVNCGKCYNCLKNRAIAWNYRLQIESQHSQMNKTCMVTYTLRDDNITRTSTGKMTLSHEHIKKTIKRLRYYEKMEGNNQPIRYFCVGEYGGKTKRPHHHIIFFNVNNFQNIVRAYSENKDNVKYKLNPIIETSKNGKRRYAYTSKKHGVLGRMTIDELTDGTRKYVANYMVKHRLDYKSENIRREYTACSQGIGYQILKSQEFINHYLHNPTNRLVVTPEGYKMPLPRYYLNKIFTKDERRLLYYEYLYSDAVNTPPPSRPYQIDGVVKLNSATYIRNQNTDYDHSQLQV